MDIRWLAQLTLKIELIIEVLPIWYSKVRQMSEILQESDLCPSIHKVGFFRPGHDPKSNCALSLRMFKRWLFYVMNHDSMTDLVRHVFDLVGRNKIRCNLEKWISWMNWFNSKFKNNGWAYKIRANTGIWYTVYQTFNRVLYRTSYIFWDSNHKKSDVLTLRFQRNIIIVHTLCWGLPDCKIPLQFS